MGSEPAVAVIGGGAWGTALAQLMAGVGRDVRLWALEPEVAEEINSRRTNSLFLPGVELSGHIEASSNLEDVVPGAGAVFMVCPSHAFREVVGRVGGLLADGAAVVCCSKGLEEGSCYTMTEVARDVLPARFHSRLAVLSGPSFAAEVARGVPTAVTVASHDPAVAREIQALVATPRFRAYTTTDVVGLELGGAVKNPLAIAAGMVGGLGLGANCLAALITRGLAEMSRLVKAKGGQERTMAGLGGLGDLVLTCTSTQSRNYTVGMRLARGESLEEILGSMRAVAEGVRNTPVVLELARRVGVEMPIVEAVGEVLGGRLTPARALERLMARELKEEFYW